MSEDNDYLLARYEKHEEYEKYIYQLVYINWSTWSCIHEKSAIKVAAKIFIKLLKKSVGDASWVFGGHLCSQRTTWNKVKMCSQVELNWNRFFIKINEVLQFLENWIRNANSSREYHFGSFFNWWGINKVAWSIYCLCKWNFGQMYFYIWIFCKQMYLKIICIQKRFVQILGASRGFYSISLHEGYSSVRTLAVRIVSWLTLCLYQRLCCRILP